MSVRGLFIVTVLLVQALPVHAQVLVLVHGYLGQGASWRVSGITHVLDRAGWEDGGHLRLQGDQVVNYRQGRPGHDKTFYTLDIPGAAPIAVQTQYLAAYMKAINRHHPGESLNIAGFSAGGLVARMYMVTRKTDEPRVASLVTIATPHLGTHLAEIGSKLQQTPLAWITPLMGASEFNYSDMLYKDLKPEAPGTFLYWLNRQVHPKARYVSIIKTGNSLIGSDIIVPKTSQNMNNVVALRGASRVLQSPGMHELTFQDAILLLQLLKVERQI